MLLMTLETDNQPAISDNIIVEMWELWFSYIMYL